MRELILGGQKSGKTRAAQARARAWLDAGSDHMAVLIATAEAHDPEMSARIARHRAERAAELPGLATHEEPRALAPAIAVLCGPRRMVVVDCLTLWLTQLAMPMRGVAPPAAAVDTAIAEVVAAVQRAPGPLVLVSNEIGLGLAPLTPEARRCVDWLGLLHQRVAAACERVTLVVAGCEVAVKRGGQ